MPRHKTVGPTKRELEILQVLWEKGANTTKKAFSESYLSAKQKRTIFE